MSENAFSVVFTAELREGAKRQQAIKALNTTFRLQNPQIQQLIQKAPAPIKHHLNKAQADKVVKALWKAGWHCELKTQGRVIYRTNKSDEDKTAQKSNLTTDAEPEKPKLKAVPNSSDNLQRISSDSYSCSVCVPKSWIRMDNLNPNACLQAGSTKSESYLIIIPQQKSALGREMSLNEYALAVTNAAMQGIENGEVLQKTSIKKNEKGLTYTQSEMKGIIASTTVHYLINSYESEDTFYTIYIWCSNDVFQKRKNVFNLLVSSFQHEK